MKQQINFYARLEPKVPLPIATIAIVGFVGLILLGYGISAGVIYSQNHDLAKALSAAKNQEQLLARQIQDKQARDQSIDLSGLESELEHLKQLKRHQELLVKYLKDPAFTNLTGFSAAFTGLARQHVQGVAVESIVLTHRGRKFSMAGKIDHPTSLPTYIERLGNEPPFSQMSFEKIDIEEKDGELGFAISSLSQSGTDT